MERRQAVLAAALALAIGFGGGFGVAKIADGRSWLAPAGANGQSAVESRVDKAWGWNLFGKPRSDRAKRRGIPKPEGFAVWRTRIDTSRPDPRACVELTRELDPRASYADFVLVSPELNGAPAVSVQGSELCLAGTGFADRRVTLLKGLKAKNGETLAANADVDFTFGDRPPYVGFAGEGVILPREDSDGVGIETINVSRLKVEVWRVPDRNLVRRQVVATDPTPEGEYAYDYGSDSPDEEGRVVWKGDVAVSGGQAGQRATTVFPLGAVLKDMPPGAYVIKAKDAAGVTTDEDGEEQNSGEPAQARRWIVFTDMALLAYSGSEGLDVTVRSLKSAKVMSGVKLTLMAKNGETLAETSTDADGRGRFLKPLLKGEGSQSARMVMAYGPKLDFALLDLDRSPVDLSGQGMGGRVAVGEREDGGRNQSQAVDGYLYTDRGIYRPGETVHLTALIRDSEARAVKDRKGVLVVRRPSGVEFKRYPFNEAKGGAVSVDVAIPRGAPRGRWYAELEMEGLEENAGEQGWSVEDFVPQRLAVDLAGQKERPVLPGETRRVDVAARFLYGAPAAGLTTQAEARIRTDSDPFPQFKDYRWGDELNPYEEKVTEAVNTVTDGEGRAVALLNAADVGETFAPVEATYTVSVFEPGGRPVREDVELKARTAPRYFGVKIDQGGAGPDGRDPIVAFDVIAVSPGGQRIAAGARWSLISERWDYDWYQDGGRWRWRRTSRETEVAKGSFGTSPAQAGRFGKRLGYGDYRLIVEDGNGARTTLRFASGWGAPAKDVEAPDVVRLGAGTAAYEQGDTVAVRLESPLAGEAQVAVATDRLLSVQNVHVPAGGTTVRLKSGPAWGGGAYILATVVQPRDPVASPKPKRALGLLYVPLQPKNRTLSVALDTPQKLDSKATLKVPLKVEGLPFGRTARVTVAAVDEGILRLTKQASPDPVKWYFGKKALSLEYRDDYGRLLDPNLGAAAKLDYGGDEVGGAGLTVVPIKSVALWSGVVETGLDGRATVTLPAADFNGELRLMAVAWTDDSVGSGSKPLTVRQAVVADLNLPRFLAPGDRAFATLELHNVEGRVGQYLAEVGGYGGVLSGFKKLVALALGQRTTERIGVNAGPISGIGGVGLKVSGPGFQTFKSYPIETRLGWGAVTRTTTELQRPGETFTPSAQLMAGLAAGSVELQVSYSPFRGFDPAAVALALNRYPYGCTEQLVSTATPLLYAQQLSADPKLRRASRALVEATGKLFDRQSTDGAFGLWKVGDGEADPWLGAYTTDFLLEARARGVPVPDAAVDRALAAMRAVSRPEGYVSLSYRTEYPGYWAATPEASKAATERMRSRASAYALYVMAKGGRGDLARLRWWHDVQLKADASPLARAHVGAGLALMGDRARAHDSFVQATRTLNYRDEQDWYQSPLRDLAGVIALAYDAGEVAVARQLQGRLENTVRDVDSLNTQEQAQLLRAADRMLRAAGPVTVQAQGVTTLPGAGGAQRFGVGRLADARLTNTGKGALWRTVTVRGTPLTAPAPEAQGVTVEKTLFTFAGGRIDPGQVRQGDRVIVRLSGRSQQGRTTQLVLDDALPAGWEVETVLSPSDAQASATDSSDEEGSDETAEPASGGAFKFLGVLTDTDVQEARDDRYVAATDLPGGSTYAVAYIARAVTPGAFLLPGAIARDMYRPQVVARTGAGRAAVAPSG